MFQKRHMEALAQVMQDSHPGAALNDDNRAVIQWRDTLHHLVLMFYSHNDRFDAERFTRACEPGANVKARK